MGNFNWGPVSRHDIVSSAKQVLKLCRSEFCHLLCFLIRHCSCITLLEFTGPEVIKIFMLNSVEQLSMKF